MKTKQQVVSEFRRTEIVDAARTVFARRGFASGIMDEIAKEAGVAKGTLYLYFRSKTEIYKAVLDHDMRALKKNTLDRIEEAKGLAREDPRVHPCPHGKCRDQAGILPHHGFRVARSDLYAQPVPRLAAASRCCCWHRPSGRPRRRARFAGSMPKRPRGSSPI